MLVPGRREGKILNLQLDLQLLSKDGLPLGERTVLLILLKRSQSLSKVLFHRRAGRRCRGRWRAAEAPGFCDLNRETPASPRLRITNSGVRAQITPPPRNTRSGLLWVGGVGFVEELCVTPGNMPQCWRSRSRPPLLVSGDFGRVLDGYSSLPRHPGHFLISSLP